MTALVKIWAKKQIDPKTSGALQAVKCRRLHNPMVKATLPLSLTMDHRVLDGAEAARFLLAFEACLYEQAHASLKQGGEPCE